MFLTACTGELTIKDPGPGGGPGGGVDAGGGGGGADAPPSAARQQFESDVVPLLELERPLGTCVSCHVDGGGVAAPTMLAGDMYDSIVNGPYLGDTGATSRFVNVGQHTGDGFCNGPGNPAAYCAENEVQIVANWVDAVNAQ